MKNKNYLLSLLTILVTAAMSLSLMSCSNDDDNGNISKTASDYLNIQGATYSEGAFPAATEEEEMEGVSVNVDEGGNSATIRISKQNNYDCYYIGIEGVSGYWVYTPSETRAIETNEDDNYWVVVIAYKGTWPVNTMMLWVTATGPEWELGRIPKPYKCPITRAENVSTKTIVGTWYTAYYVVTNLYDNEHVDRRYKIGVQYPISKYGDTWYNLLFQDDLLYQEWVFKKNDRAERWSRDDDFPDGLSPLPIFQYEQNGNKIKVTATHTSDFVDLGNGETMPAHTFEEDFSVFNTEFTFDPVKQELIEHFCLTDDDLYKVMEFDVYYKKR